MIEYDYKIVRNEGNETRVFVPKEFAKKLPNLVYMEGRNSSGKSTLLNLVALGFYGLNLDKMNESLKEKMRDLASSDHQKVQFEIVITGKDGRPLLVSRKSEDEQVARVKKYEGGKEKPITYERFFDEYNLIYDLPDNPTERLEKLVVEIQEFQNGYGAKVHQLQDYIHEIIDEIKNSRNPKRIKELKAAIESEERKISDLQQKSVDEGKLLALLEKYTAARFLDKYLRELGQIDARREILEENKTKTRKIVRKISKKVEIDFRKVAGMIEEMRKLQFDVASLLECFIPKDERHHLTIWQNIDLDRAKKEYEFSDNLAKEIRILRGIVDKLTRSSSVRKEMEEVEFLNNLLDFLKRYETAEVTIPGLGKTIEDLIDALEKEVEKRRSTKKLLDKITETVNMLNQLEEKKREAENLLAELQRNSKEFEGVQEETLDTAEELDAKMEEYQRKFDEIDEKCKRYEQDCARTGVDVDVLPEVLRDLANAEDLSVYLNNDEEELRDTISDMKERLQSYASTIKSIENRVSIYKHDLRRNEMCEPHEYQDRQDDLQELFKKCQILSKKLLHEYKVYLTSISKRSANRDMTDDEERYFSEISRYLGKRLGRIRHIDDEYVAREVDLVKRRIITEEDKILPFSVFGSGQGEMTYLMGLLNTDDKRKIIALIDEVATMDPYSLKPVLVKLKELHDADRLIAAIVVRPARDSRAISIEEAIENA